MFKKSLATILSNFNKTATELNNFITYNTEEMEVLEVQISNLEGKQDELADETRKAQNVLNNINKILGE